MSFSLSRSTSRSLSGGSSRISPEVRRHSEDVLSRCKEGDLLEFPREGYSHWAVYIGGEKVIHLTGNMKDMAKVMEESFWDVVEDSLVMINNYLDATKYVRSGKEILERARSRLGKASYNPLSNNCEHFATWCRYGEERSVQATAALVVGAHVGVMSVMAGVVGLGAWWLWSGLKKVTRRENKQRKQAS